MKRTGICGDKNDECGEAGNRSLWYGVCELQLNRMLEVCGEQRDGVRERAEEEGEGSGGRD